MKSGKTKFASILLSLVLALGLMPGPAMATGADSGARNNAKGNGLQALSFEQPITTQETVAKQQAIQVASMSVFKTETGKKVSAKVVEGDGAISYAVKAGSEAYIDVDASSGALTVKAVPSDNIAYVTVTAAETSTYAATSVDAPIKVYDQYEYEISLWTVQYAIYNSVYNLSSLDIKLFDKSGNVVGSATVQNPRNGSKVKVSATNFADRVEMTAHIQIPRRDPITLTGSGGIGGSIDVWNKTSRSGKVFTCNYGMNAPEPEYTAPVAKTNLTANGTNQILVHPGSVSLGGHMEYNLGTESGPSGNGWWTGVGVARAANPGTYYVWWRTHNTDYYTARYVGQGRSEIGPQRIAVTIGKGAISPTVSIEDWTYGEEAKTPTVTGNTGNGAVTYEYKVKGSEDGTYTEVVPTDAGDYTVRATIADTASYSGGTATKDFAIAKAKVPQQEVRVVGLIGTVDKPSPHWEANITKSLAGMMPDGAEVLSYEAGAPTCAGGATTLPEGVTFTSNVDSDGVVTAKLEIPSSADGIPAQAQEITLPVTVKSKNYEDSTINVVVEPTEKEEKTVTITGIPDLVTYGESTFTLTAAVKDGDNAVETKAGDWYWYSSDPSVLEVPAIADPNTGSSTVAVTVKNPGSAMILAWYEPGDGDTIGAALTDPITVNKKSVSPAVSISGWKYGEAPNAPVLAEGSNPGGCTVAYGYKAKGADDSSYTEEIPTQAGDYTVRATVPESTYHQGATCTANFTIGKIPVEATVTAKDKTYDGTTAANVSAVVGEGVLEGDVVKVASLKGAFDNPKAGKDKKVKLDAKSMRLVGEGSSNYEVKLPSDPIASSILKRHVYVKANDKSSRYGQNIAALTYSLYGSTKLVTGDTLKSLGVTARTKATKRSNAGSYRITLSGGTANPNYEVTLNTKAGKYTIKKAANTLKVTSKTVKIPKSKKAKTIKRAKVLAVSKAKGKLAYKKLSGNKKIAVNPKNGDVKVQGGLKKTTYKVRVKVTAAGNGNYESGSRTVTFKVQVR